MTSPTITSGVVEQQTKLLESLYIYCCIKILRDSEVCDDMKMDLDKMDKINLSKRWVWYM